MSRIVTAFIALVLVSASDMLPSIIPEGRAGEAGPLLVGAALATLVLPGLAVFLLLRPAPGEHMPRSFRRLKRARKLSTVGPLLGFLVLLSLGARPMSSAWVPPQIAGGASLLLLLPFVLGWFFAVREWTRFELRSEKSDASLRRAAFAEFRAPFLIFSASIVISAFQDLAWAFPQWRETVHTHPFAPIGGIVFSMTCMVLFSPTAVGLIHPKHPLPDGELRDRFEATAKAARTRLGRVDIWDTGPRPGLNACVAGAIPRYRRVFFTDGLIQALETDELAGVFAHELAHSKLNHLWIYIGLIVGLSGIALGIEDRVALALAAGTLSPVPPTGSIEIVMLLFLGLFFFRFFGAMSRHLESQADIFSAKTTGSPWGIVSALQKIGRITGTLERRAGWRHPAIPDRIATVLNWWENPAKQAVFRRRTRRLLLIWGSVLLLGCLGGAVSFRTALERPTWRQNIDRAEYLIVSVHGRRERPWSDPTWESREAERARALLVDALEELPLDPRTAATRLEIYRTLAHTYRLLEDPWSAAMADYFSLPRR